MKKCALLLFFLLLPSLVRAEVIVLKNGRVVLGNILEETRDSITVNDGGIEITYYLDEIEKISQDERLVKDYWKKQNEDSQERMKYYKELNASLNEKSGSENLSPKERIQILSEKMEEEYGDRDEVVMDNNDRLARSLLDMLAQSAENYVTFHQGRYPTSAADLGQSLCGKTKSGFRYRCDLSASEYTFKAIPEIPGKTGSKTLTVSSKGRRKNDDLNRAKSIMQQRSRSNRSSKDDSSKRKTPVDPRLDQATREYHHYIKMLRQKLDQGLSMDDPRIKDLQAKVNKAYLEMNELEKINNKKR